MSQQKIISLCTSFFKELSYAHQGCIYLIKKYSNIVKYFILQYNINVFYFNTLQNIIYSFDAKS